MITAIKKMRLQTRKEKSCVAEEVVDLVDAADDPFIAVIVLL